uniref:M20/M25/M40 family metallo-hydrolase n=1 Tax=uncultured Ellagibacter sp. TaxID=2137580 RepID=UPI0026328596
AEDMGCAFEMAEHLGPIYFKRDDEVVVLLEKAYRDVTGDMESEPFTVGAATFARTMRNTVAFGPIFPGQVEMSHLPNEFIAIEDLDKCTEIYIRALSNLLTRENKGR